MPPNISVFTTGFVEGASSGAVSRDGGSTTLVDDGGTEVLGAESKSNKSAETVGVRVGTVTLGFG
jgi:hypothetical protein